MNTRIPNPTYRLERKKQGADDFEILVENYTQKAYLDNDVESGNDYEYRISCQWDVDADPRHPYGSPLYSYGGKYTYSAISLESVNFEGTVLSWNNKDVPVSGSTAVLTRADSSEFTVSAGQVASVTATTDKKGVFRFSGIYPGIYRLVITGEDYADTLVQVLGISKDSTSIVTYQKQLSADVKGANTPFELDVSGIYSGYTDLGNSLLSGAVSACENGKWYLSYGYQKMNLTVKPLSPQTGGGYGDLTLSLKIGGKEIEPFPIDVEKYPLALQDSGVDISWDNKALSHLHPSHSLISLFATGNEDSPLTHLAYPITLAPSDP